MNRDLPPATIMEMEMDLIKNLRTKPPTYEDAVAAANEIERLWEQERKMTNHALERMEEIERLREALKRISEIGDYPTQLTIARSALQQKDTE